MAELKIKDVAARLECSAASVVRWCDKGLLPYRKTGGGHRRFLVKDVEAFLVRSRDPRGFAPHPLSKEGKALQEQKTMKRLEVFLHKPGSKR